MGKITKETVIKELKPAIYRFIFSFIILAIGYYYFTDKPRVYYSLSPEFYTTLEEKANREVYQYLVIKNNGSEKADRLIIKINKQVPFYEINKHSSFDLVDVLSDKNKFEMKYDLLPPDAQIEILLRNYNQGITYKDLKISFATGLGVEVFEKDNTTIKAIFYVVGVLLLALMSLQLWRSANKLDRYSEHFEKINVRLKETLSAAQARLEGKARKNR